MRNVRVDSEWFDRSVMTVVEVKEAPDFGVQVADGAVRPQRLGFRSGLPVWNVDVLFRDADRPDVQAQVIGVTIESSVRPPVVPGGFPVFGDVRMSPKANKRFDDGVDASMRITAGSLAYVDANGQPIKAAVDVETGELVDA